MRQPSTCFYSSACTIIQLLITRYLIMWFLSFFLFSFTAPHYLIHGNYSVSAVPSWMWFTMKLLHCGFLKHFCHLLLRLPFPTLPLLLPVSLSTPTSCHSEPGLSLPPSLPPPPVPPSSHEFIMWSKIEQWLFVPVPACHWSRMNNSALVVEVGISEERGNYFGAAPFELFSKRRAVASFPTAHTPSSFFLPSCSRLSLPPVHSLPHKKEETLLCCFCSSEWEWLWKWMNAAPFVCCSLRVFCGFINEHFCRLCVSYIPQSQRISAAI